jgi:peptidoglycan/xylan/chitin deacetylase (PgdA/CDA1 family)
MFDLTLTFDNGPEPDVTPHVLDVLKRRDVRATFFVLGKKLAMPGRRALAERAKAEGHWIGNHTWSHSGPLGRRPGSDVAEQEITRTQDELGLLSDPGRLFRPQGGGGKLGPHLLSTEASALLKRGRYTCVLWNAIPHDWDNPDGWVERALGQVKEREWTLMVLHDIPSGAMRHLDRFLDGVTDQNGRLRQDFPPPCLPMIEGIVSSEFDRDVSGKE